jgi:hypothetical protein
MKNIIVNILILIILISCFSNGSNESHLDTSNNQQEQNPKNPVKDIDKITDSKKRHTTIKEFIDKTSIEELKTKLDEKDKKTGENLAHKILENNDLDIDSFTKVYQAKPEIVNQPDNKGQTPKQTCISNLSAENYEKIITKPELNVFATEVTEDFLKQNVLSNPNVNELRSFNNPKTNLKINILDELTKVGNVYKYNNKDVFAGNAKQQQLFENLQQNEKKPNSINKQNLVKVILNNQNVTLFENLKNTLENIIDSRTNLEKRKEFLNINGNFSGVTSIYFNTNANKISMIPATFVADYGGGGQVLLKSTLAIKFNNTFLDKLPLNIKKTINKYKVFNNNVDIFFILEPLSQIGEKENHIGQASNQHTSRLKAHFWLDPDACLDLPGDRLNTNILYGVFDSDFDISLLEEGTNGVELNKMKYFNVHIHDNSLSPKTAGIKIDTAKSQSFWSLVIDDKNSDNVIRANATLHCLLKDEDFLELDKYIYSFFDANNKPKVSSLLLAKLLEDIDKIPRLKNISCFTKLNNMFN